MWSITSCLKSLRCPVQTGIFKDRNLYLRTKGMIYRSVILGLLLHGVETWVNKSAATRKLESFNSASKCLTRCILDITRTQQRKYNLTRVQVRRRFGAEEALEDVVTSKRL